jgi:hypothetical protein
MQLQGSVNSLEIAVSNQYAITVERKPLVFVTIAEVS